MGDPDEVEGDDTGRFIKMDVNFKDYPLKFNWGKRLRNLKFTSTIKSLMDMKIISPCVATSKSIRTNDNVTYEYQADSQWTLVSGHCAQTPSYGVFTKRDGPQVYNHDLYRRSPNRNQKWRRQNQWQRYISSKWKVSQTF